MKFFFTIIFFVQIILTIIQKRQRQKKILFGNSLALLVKKNSILKNVEFKKGFLILLKRKGLWLCRFRKANTKNGEIEKKRKRIYCGDIVQKCEENKRNSIKEQNSETAEIAEETSRQKKSFLLTTPIYYGNDKPHIGHAYCNILGDVIVRYEKLKRRGKKGNRNHILFSGMDEHGLKIEMKSKKLKINSQQYVDEVCKYYKKMNQAFNIHVDIFYRTSNTFHKYFVQNVWTYLLKSNVVYKDVYRGYYDINEERYLSEAELCERHITRKEKEQRTEIDDEEENKRQSEKEQKKEKYNIIYIEEPNSYFFNVLHFKQFLVDFFENNETFLYPSYLRKEILYILKNELKDICISRYNTNWGVQIPTEKRGTIYVWFDALLSYVSAVLLYSQQKRNTDPTSISEKKEEIFTEKESADADFWKLMNREEKEKKKREERKIKKHLIKEETNSFHHTWSPNVQIIGKDILKFHCILYICLLKSLHLDFPQKLICHGLITNNNKKMSKSLNNVVSPFDLLKKYSADVLRMYFIGCSNIYEDKNYNEQNIKNVESFLRNNIGNLVYRVISLCIANDIHRISKIDDIAYKNSSILEECRLKKEEFVQLINKLEYPYFIEKIMTLIKKVNKYFVHMEPWKLANQKNSQFQIIIYETLESIKFFSVFLYPVIPQISLKIFKMLGLSMEKNDISFSLLEAATPQFVLKELTKLI